MTTLDVLIALFVLLVVLRGARTGLLAGAFSLVGVVLGAALGSRLAQVLLPEDESPIFGAGITLITLISILAFAVFGEVVARAAGGALRARLSNPASEALDGLGGAALGLALSLALVWAVGLFAAGLHPAMQESRILQALNERMPSELLTKAVTELSSLPQLPLPEADVALPNERAAKDPEVLAASSRTVRVSSIACGYGIEGSGWVAAPDLVVTNAHVVAGEAITSVQPGGAGPRYRAHVVLFDVRNDVAILRVAGLGLAPMRLTSPTPGEPAAVLGFPKNGPLDIEPARTGATRRVISADAYNRGPVERAITRFRVHVRPGNSGGPVINTDGEVVATVFASRASSSNTGYGIPSQIVQRRLAVAAERTEPVSTGGCAN
jgi:S1-C subfamily serine protease